MARDVHEREDLLRDARALVPRVMLRLNLEGQDAEVFAGFRGQSLSLYFNRDPVYHFNARGELRRAYVDDRLVKAERGRLVVLARESRELETRLLRQASDPKADQKLVDDLKRRLASLAARLSTGEFVMVGEALPDSGAVARVAAWLAEHSAPGIAASPRVD